MTTHLRDTEFVDFAEGTLAAPRAAHLDTCADCRAQAEAMSGALRDAAAVEMPEPSPLFWEHFNARVRDEVAHETPERATWWSGAGLRVLMPLVAALAVIIAIFSAAMLPRLTQPAPAPASPSLVASHTTADEASAAMGTDSGATVDDQNGDVWTVLTAAASDIGLDDAHVAGMGVRPGAVDHAVTHMSQAELTELGRLLQTQLKGSGH